MYNVHVSGQREATVPDVVPGVRAVLDLDVATEVLHDEAVHGDGGVDPLEEDGVEPQGDGG